MSLSGRRRVAGLAAIAVVAAAGFALGYGTAPVQKPAEIESVSEAEEITLPRLGAASPLPDLAESSSTAPTGEGTTAESEEATTLESSPVEEAAPAEATEPSPAPSPASPAGGEELEPEGL